MLRFATVALLLLGAGCSPRTEPHEAELRTFRATLGAPAETLVGGSLSADALVHRWVRAVQAADTVELRRMAVTPAEFAYLYYPSSPIARPPYDLSPELMWLQLESNSGKGLRDVLRKRGGEALHVLAFECDAPEAQGPNRVHAGCRVLRRGAQGDTTAERLFGAILERDDRFKFLSYSSRL
jgi:hypothetical protein